MSELVAELSAEEDSLRTLRNYMIWRLVATFYPSKYRDEGRRGEQCLKQTEDVFGPVSISARGQSSIHTTKPDPDKHTIRYRIGVTKKMGEFSRGRAEV